MRLALSAAWMAILALALSAQAADVHAILAASRQRIEASDFSVSGHLVSVQPDGTRLSCPITIKAHWFPGVLKVLLDIANVPKTGPGSLVRARRVVHALIEMHSDGQIQILVARPGDKSPSVLPFEKWSDGLIGPAFSYEDFLEDQVFWPEQTLVEQTKFGPRDCDVVKSTPGGADKTHYAEVKTWFDRKIAFPVYLEKKMKETGTVKEFTSYGLRQDDGVWSTHQIEVKTQGQAGSTLLIIDRGTAKAYLTQNDFSPAQLTRF